MRGADARYWDAVAEQPDALPAGWRRHSQRAHLDLVARWVGTPSGRWLKTDVQEELSPTRALLPHLGGAWVGVDLSPLACGRAAERTGAATVAADVRALPFAAGVFGGVLSTSTLDHFDSIADPHAALAELRRVLRPGGVLILTLDNRANPLIRLRNWLPENLQRRTGLVPFRVGETLDARRGHDALEAAGFEVQSVEHLLHAPHILGTRPARWAWWERRALPAFDRAGYTRLARWTGHYVAFLARAR